MDSKEAIKKINFKTMLSFLAFFLFSFILCLLKSTLDLRESSDLYHIQFYLEYIKNNSLLIFFKNMFFFTLLYFSFCYSLIIFKNDYAVSKGQRLIFSQIVARGLYILIFLTLLYFVGGEFFVPAFENKLDSLKNNTVRAKNLLDSANRFYDEQKFVQSLKNYEEYIQIIEDDEVKVRVRELRVKVADILLKKEKDILKEDTTIAESVTDYLELARIFYEKKDYLSSLYYYLHVKDANDKKDIKECNEQIAKIKDILRYKNAFMTDAEFNVFLDDTLKEIQNIYEMKKKAEKYEENHEIQKALFVFNDILKINSSLRDVISSQNNAYMELTNLGVEIRNIENARIFDGKSKLTFMLKENVMISIGFITKVQDTDKLENVFYLYDIRIYTINKDFKISNQIYAPFGQSKGRDFFTLYCFSIDNRDIEYFPIPEVIEVSLFDNFLEKVSNINSEYLNNFYENHEGVYRLKKELSDEDKIKIGKIIKETGFNVISIIDNGKDRVLDYILKFPVDINIVYNFSYDYNKALNFSLYKLFTLKDFNIKDIEKSNYTLGFNNNFLKTAIVDKISRIFLFFAFSLIFISLAWKLRANYIGGFPIIYIPLSVIIFIFIYFIANIIQIYSTFFYSMISFGLPFSTILIVSFLINIAITIFSIVFIASTKV